MGEQVESTTLREAGTLPPPHPILSPTLGLMQLFHLAVNYFPEFPGATLANYHTQDGAGGHKYI